MQIEHRSCKGKVQDTGETYLLLLDLPVHLQLRSVVPRSLLDETKADSKKDREESGKEVVPSDTWYHCRRRLHRPFPRILSPTVGKILGTHNCIDNRTDCLLDAADDTVGVAMDLLFGGAISKRHGCEVVLES